MFSRRSHSCPFVSIRGSKHRFLFVPFRVFRGPIPPTTSLLRFIRENPCSSVARKTPLIRLIRGLEPRLPGGPSPFTPGPSPLSGARGASSASTRTKTFAGQRHIFCVSCFFCMVHVYPVPPRVAPVRWGVGGRYCCLLAAARGPGGKRQLSVVRSAVCSGQSGAGVVPLR